MAKTYKTALVIEGDAKGGVRAVKATREQISKLDKGSKRAAKSVSLLSTATSHIRQNASMYGLAIAGATTGLVYMTARTAASVRETHSLAQAIGVSTGSLQAFAYAAEQAGMNADKAADIVKDLTDKVGEAAISGGGELGQVLDTIGLSAQRLVKMNPTQQLLAIAGAIEDLPKPQQVHILESIADDASRILPLLRNGGALLRKYASAAYDMNVAMGPDEIRRMLEANKAMNRLEGEFRGIANTITIAAAPAIAEIGDNIADMIDEARDGGELQAFFDGLASSVETLSSNMWDLVKGISAAALALKAASAMSRYGIKGIIGGAVGGGAVGYVLPDLLKGVLFDDVGGGSTGQLAELQQQAADTKKTINELTSAIKTWEDLEDSPLVDMKVDKLAERLGTKRQELTKLQKEIFRAKSVVHLEPIVVNAPPLPSDDGGGNGGGNVSDQIAAAEKLQRKYQSLVASYQQQIALFDETSEVAQMRYRLEFGDLAKLSQPHKQYLISLAQEKQALQDQKSVIQSLFPLLSQLRRVKSTSQLARTLPPGLSGLAHQQLRGQIGGIATSGAPGGMPSLDATVGGAFGEANRLQRQKVKYQEWYAQRLAMLRTFKQKEYGVTAQANVAIAQLNQQHQTRIAAYETQMQQARLAGAASMFGEMADLTKAFAGEQSGLYKAMFAISKAFSIAQSIIAIQTGIAKAMSLPFPENLAAAASVASAAASIVSNIQAVTLSLSGQAHDGIDSVPNSGTWNLEKGERVIDRRTNADLKTYLSRANGGTVTRGGNVINFAPTVQVQARPGVSAQEANQQGRQIGEALRGEFRKLVVDEQRPGGLLAGTA